MLRNTKTYIVPYVNPEIKANDWVYWDGEFKGQVLTKELTDYIFFDRDISQNLWLIEKDGVIYQVATGFTYRKHNEFRYLNGLIVTPGTELQIRKKAYFHGDREVVPLEIYSNNENIYLNIKLTSFTSEFNISDTISDETPNKFPECEIPNQQHELQQEQMQTQQQFSQHEKLRQQLLEKQLRNKQLSEQKLHEQQLEYQQQLQQEKSEDIQFLQHEKLQQQLHEKQLRNKQLSEQKLHEQQLMLRNTKTYIVPYINPEIKPNDWVYWDGEFKDQILKKELVDSIFRIKGLGRSNLFSVEKDGVTYQVVSGVKYRKHNEFRYLNGDIVAPGTELQIQNQAYFHGEKEVVTYGIYLENQEYEEKKRLELCLKYSTNMFHTLDPIPVKTKSISTSNNTNNKRPLPLVSNIPVSHKKIKPNSQLLELQQKHELKQKQMQKRFYQQRSAKPTTTTSTLIVPFIDPNIKFTDWIFCDGEFNGVKLEGKIVKTNLIPSIDKNNNSLMINGSIYNVIYAKNYINNNKFNYSDNGESVAAGTKLETYDGRRTKHYLHGKRNVETYKQYEERRYKKEFEELKSHYPNLTSSYSISNNVKSGAQSQTKSKEISHKKVTHEEQKQLQHPQQIQHQQFQHQPQQQQQQQQFLQQQLVQQQLAQQQFQRQQFQQQQFQQQQFQQQQFQQQQFQQQQFSQQLIQQQLAKQPMQQHPTQSRNDNEIKSAVTKENFPFQFFSANKVPSTAKEASPKHIDPKFNDLEFNDPEFYELDSFPELDFPFDVSEIETYSNNKNNSNRG